MFDLLKNRKMKIFNKYIALSMLLVMAFACNDGIDDITPLKAGPDESAPVITFKYPLEGTQIMVTNPVTSINIRFEVTDDIEIALVKVSLDGTEIASYNNFIDYRRLVGNILYDQVTNGEHTLTVVATDLDGKSTTTSVTFMKVPPYQPKFNGEIFYMPFDGDYMELITQTEATKVGNPGFSTSGKSGQAYAGATDSYLSFSADNLKNSQFSAAFWYKPNASPDRAGLISISPTGEDRTKGIRFFREGSASSQRFKLNVGTGAGETWNDGNTIDVPNDWVHLAFTISETACIIYINGEVALTAATAGVIDWAGCNTISIGSGAPNFAYWDHKSDLSLFDELRIFNKALSQLELQAVMADGGQPQTYVPKYNGEVFYMPFDGNNKELISQTDATTVGTPGFAGQAKKGANAYAGATDSYLTFPTSTLTANAFSAVFWYKPNANPDRAGLISISPPGEDRTKGLRFFREGNATSQRFKLNVGTGAAEVWNDGGTVTTPTTDWVHLAFTISETACVIYINGEIALSADTPGAIDWTGCSSVTIGSGAPNFAYWDHKSDLSFMDELRFFNKALSQQEIQTIIDDEN